MTRRVLILGGVLAAVACGDPEIVVPGVLSVDFYPPNGSVDIAVNVQGLIAFSHEVDNADTAAAAIGLQCLGSPHDVTGCLDPDSTDCVAASVTVAVDNSGMEARVTPNSSLEGNTCYVYTVAAAIEAAADNVGPLPSDRRSAFQTR